MTRCDFCHYPHDPADLHRRDTTRTTLHLCDGCCDAWDERWRKAGPA